MIIAKKRDFKAYDIDIEFDDEALRLIAERAHKSKTGARGLIGVMEKILIKFEKKLPSSTVKSLTVTRSVVENPLEELTRILAEAPPLIHELEERFQEEHDIVLTLDDDARTTLAEMAEEQNKSPADLGMELFRDYVHGLKLVQTRELKITAEAIRNPGEYLDTLIKKFYEKTAAKTEGSGKQHGI